MHMPTLCTDPQLSRTAPPRSQSRGLFTPLSVEVRHSATCLASLPRVEGRNTFICVLEEHGIAATYLEVVAQLAGRDVIHFADNTAANTAVCYQGGLAAAPDMARIVAALHLRLARLHMGRVRDVRS